MPAQEIVLVPVESLQVQTIRCGDNPILFEGASFANLKMAVTELIKAIAGALRDEREAAEQFVEHAAGLLFADGVLLERIAPYAPDGPAAWANRLGLWNVRPESFHSSIPQSHRHDSDGTGNSNSIRAFWMPLRKAAAGGRATLVEAIVQSCGIPGASIDAQDDHTAELSFPMMRETANALRS